jgi:glycerol-1-phosphate dehydrogenase [NAD(P)+]
MSFAGSSRPASGSEHHLSHYFEITGIVRNKPYFSHGIDVAYSTVITAKLRELILSKPWPDVQYRPERSVYEQEIHRIYGSVAQGCIDLQDKTGRYEKDYLPVYKENEAALRSILEEMPKASEIEAMLTAVGLDISEFYKLYGKENIADAIAYGKELKDRYSVLWMYYDLFGGNENAI